MTTTTSTTPAPSRHRPRSLTVFAAAFIAGAAAAVGVNRVLDVQLAQRKPQVECEPIFVALRSLPQGTPVTVWDVALKDWPKAMLPATALRAHDSFEGFVLRHAIREGQPILALQLVRAEPAGGQTPATMAGESFVAPVPAAAPVERQATTPSDLWTPSETETAAVPATPSTTDVAVSEPSPPATTPSEATTPSAVAPAEPTQVEQVDPTPTAVVQDEEPRKNDAESADEPQVAATAAEPAADATTATPTPEPVASGPTLASQLPVPPSPVDIDPPPAKRPTPALGQKTAPTTTEAVATDVSTMPSVMTHAGDHDAAASPRGSQGARYLVVPERIALQADTSFTTPRPQPPGPPAVAPPSAPRQGPQAGATARTRQQQPSSQVQGRRGGPQQRQPRPAAPQANDAQPPAAPAQQRWGGLFPNVSAGIDAVGASWQRMRTTEQQPDDTGDR